MFDDEGYCFVVGGGPSINLKEARLYTVLHWIVEVKGCLSLTIVLK